MLLLALKPRNTTRAYIMSLTEDRFRNTRRRRRDVWNLLEIRDARRIWRQNI